MRLDARSRPGVPIGVALLVVAASCSTPPAALRADTQAYLQRMSSWAPAEAETAHTLERILATEFVDEGEVLRQIADSTPRIRRHLEEVERYEPRTTEVRRIHAIYTKAWSTLLEGYRAIGAGFEQGEQSKVAEGRDAMARWRDAILRVAHELRELRDRVGVEPDTVTPS